MNTNHEKQTNNEFHQTDLEVTHRHESELVEPQMSPVSALTLSDIKQKIETLGRKLLTRDDAVQVAESLGFEFQEVSLENPNLIPFDQQHRGVYSEEPHLARLLRQPRRYLSPSSAEYLQALRPVRSERRESI